MDIATAFRTYLDQPSKASLSRLHAAIVASEDFERATPWLSRAEQLLSQERYDEVIRLITQRMPGLLLCPIAHSMLSYSYEQIFETERSRREAYYAGVAMEAILDSGSGTQADPWKVLHVADEYAVLEHRGLEPLGQQSQEESGMFDVVECSDGSQRWFSLV